MQSLNQHVHNNKNVDKNMFAFVCITNICKTTTNINDNNCVKIWRFITCK